MGFSGSWTNFKNGSFLSTRDFFNKFWKLDTLDFYFFLLRPISNNSSLAMRHTSNFLSFPIRKKHPFPLRSFHIYFKILMYLTLYPSLKFPLWILEPSLFFPNVHSPPHPMQGFFYLIILILYHWVKSLIPPYTLRFRKHFFSLTWAVKS